MGAHCHVLEADGTLRLNRFGRPTVRTLLFPASEATLLDTWRTIGLRGTASDSYCVNDLFVSEAFSTTREDPTLRRERGPLYAFTMQGLYAAGVAAVGFGIARAMLSEFIALASRKAPRGLARLADNAVVQADVARAEARLGSARAYLIETLSTIYAHADDVAPIEVADRARVRLACTNAIQGGGRGGRLRLQGSGRRRDLPGQPVRAPLPRHAHALSADPGTRRSFRVGRADPARRAARGVSLRSGESSPDADLQLASGLEFCRFRSTLRRGDLPRPPD